MQDADRPYPPVVVIGWHELVRLQGLVTSPADSADQPAAMSVIQAATYLGVSRSHAYDLVRAGKLPHVRLGRRILIPRRELDALLHQPSRLPA